MIETRVCKWCGTQFERKPTFSNQSWARTRCCSRKCGAFLRSQNPAYLRRLGDSRREWNLAHPVEAAARIAKAAATKGVNYPTLDPKRAGRGRAQLMYAITPCEDCGQLDHRPRAMQRHHIDLDQTNNDRSNIAILCSGCHGVRHRGDRTRYRGGSQGQRKTVCKHGHALTPDNIYVSPSGGSRHCQACITHRNRTYQRKRV